MTLIKHELRRNASALAIWTGAIGFLIAVCVFLFPEMKGQMEGVSQIFSSMGSFTAAFGMDRLNFGTLTGFYAVECGNILGLGGAFCAALWGISALAKEEKERTAEFLLTHPVSRAYVVGGKLAALGLEILILNLATLGLSLLSMVATGETIPWKEILLLHGAYFLLQMEIGLICFGLSAFLRGGSLGLGLGLATMLYFLNLIANISESCEFLKYITPFGYAEGADIVTSGALDWPLVLLGLGYGLVLLAAGSLYYSRKDIT